MARWILAIVIATTAHAQTVTDDFENGLLGWTNVNGCSGGSWIIAQSGTNHYAQVIDVCSCATPEMVMVRTQQAYESGYVQCRIARFACDGCNGCARAGGPVFRCATSGSLKLVTVSFRPAGARLWVYENGQATEVGSVLTPFNEGDLVRIEYTGRVVTIKRQDQTGWQSVASFTSLLLDLGRGHAGLRVAHDSAGTGFDDFECGPLP